MLKHWLRVPGVARGQFFWLGLREKVGKLEIKKLGNKIFILEIQNIGADGDAKLKIFLRGLTIAPF